MMADEVWDVPLKQIKITNPFWHRYSRLVKAVMIPYQWNVLRDQQEGAEPSHCIHNFKVAAGMVKGEIKGVVFLDSDLAKWLEAVAYTLESDPDPDLERLADQAIELIGGAQQPDGYLNTYFTVKEPEQRFLNLQEGHELYVAGHMIEAAVAYYHATGKTQFLNIMCRMADLLCRHFGSEAGQCCGYPGHQEIELALIKLYRITGTRKYLELARHFIEVRGTGENYFTQEERKGGKRIFPELQHYQPVYSQSHLPVRKQLTAEGHAVRAVYMYSAMADLAYEYQDQTLLEACQRLWNNIVEKRMYITGGIGSSGILERFTTDYDLPNDRAYAETCASIGMAMFGRRMAKLTGDASYLDVVELELYNTILAGLAVDGKSFFYVNPLEVQPEHCIPRTSLEHVKPERQKWFGVACCPPNLARMLASIGQYILFTGRQSIYVNLYISSQSAVRIGEKELTVHLDSQMPQQGRCNIWLEGSADQPVTMALRIPGYAENFNILNQRGESISYRILNNYAHLEMCPYSEVYTLQWEMPAVFIRSNPLVKENAGKVAVMKGPIVYCLEEIDNGSCLWNIFVDTSKSPEEIVDDSFLAPLTYVQLSGKRIKAACWGTSLYAHKQLEWEAVKVKAIPYFLWNNRGVGEMSVWIKALS